MYNISTKNFKHNAAHAWTHETNNQDTKQSNELQIGLTWIQLWLVGKIPKRVQQKMLEDPIVSEAVGLTHLHVEAS